MTEDDPTPDGTADTRADTSTADGAGTDAPTDPGAEEPSTGTGTEEPPTDPPDGGAMRARTWTVAAAFHDPADYGIPPLPEWTVYKEAGGGMALGAADGDGVFIAADDPIKIRR